MSLQFALLSLDFQHALHLFVQTHVEVVLDAHLHLFAGTFTQQAHEHLGLSGFLVHGYLFCSR